MSSTPVATKVMPKASRSPIDLSQIQFTSQKQKDAVAALVEEFTITPQLLKDIKDHFIVAMKKGLKKDGETVAMISSYVLGRLDGTGKIMGGCDTGRSKNQ
jgi:hexokinase